MARLEADEITNEGDTSYPRLPNGLRSNAAYMYGNSTGNIANGVFVDFTLPAGFHSALLTVTSFETSNAASRRASLIFYTMRYGGFAQTTIHSFTAGGAPSFSISSPAVHTLRFTNNYANPCTISFAVQGNIT